MAFMSMFCCGRASTSATDAIGIFNVRDGAEMLRPRLNIAVLAPIPSASATMENQRRRRCLAACQTEKRYLERAKT